MQLGFTDDYGIGFPYGKKGGVFYLAGVITQESPLAHGATNDLLITVRTPDGQPVPHAQVEVSSPGKIPWLHFSRFLGGDYITDSKGQFYLPPTVTNQLLGVANADGFGYLRSDELMWIQGFLGDWSNDKITSAYGVYAIPAIFLIGPDGKVAATNLRGPKIKETVAAALAE